MQPHDSRVMFHGLRVRMGGHTARVTHFAADPATGQLQYRGSLLQTARAVSDACAGGQIVFTQATISAVHSMTHLTSSKYGDVVLLHEGRHYLTAPPAEEVEAAAAQHIGGPGGSGVTPCGGHLLGRDAPALPGHFQRMLADEIAEEDERRAAEAAERERAPPHGGVAGVDASSLMWLSGYSGPVGEGCAGQSGGLASSLRDRDEGAEGGMHIHALDAHQCFGAIDAVAMPDRCTSGSRFPFCCDASELHVADGDVGPVAEGVDGDDAGGDTAPLPPGVAWARAGPAYDQLGQVSPERPCPAAAAVNRGDDSTVGPRGHSQSFEFPTGVHGAAGVTEETVRLAQPLADLPERVAGLRHEPGVGMGPMRGTLAAGLGTPDAGGLRSSGASSSLASQVPRRESWSSLAGTDAGTPSGAFPQLHVTFQGPAGTSQNICQEIRGIREQYLRTQLQNHRQGAAQVQQQQQPAPLTLSEDFLQRVRVATLPECCIYHAVRGGGVLDQPATSTAACLSTLYVAIDQRQPED